jgi:thiamine biosynthesis protein ThiI
MKILFLLKPGELVLKRSNRIFFDRILRRNIREKLGNIPHALENKHNRLLLRVEEEDADRVVECLRKTIGISGFARTETAPKTIEDILATSERVAAGVIKANRGPRFKVLVSREDKSFPLDSYGIACRVGDSLLTRFPDLRVDVKKPNWILHIEVRKTVFCYAFAEEGARGLPVGAAGKGLLLLSGGIDSPVAGYLMAKRGLKLDAVYFHSSPYTSPEAREKVETLAQILSEWTGRIGLTVIPFTEIQVHIRKKAPSEETTLLSRACMMRIATILAYRRHANSLITGESLSQVASQTAESLRFTGAQAEFPVLRPLIGLDKETIIDIARRIGTYETSILPYEDCCAVFSPRHPLIRPEFGLIMKSYEGLDIEEMLRTAVRNAEVVKIG